MAHPQSGSSSTWFLVEIEFGNVGFLRRGENRSTRRKTQPTYGVNAGIWTRATLVGGKRSHHCTIPCSPVLPYYDLCTLALEMLLVVLVYAILLKHPKCMVGRENLAIDHSAKLLRQYWLDGPYLECSQIFMTSLLMYALQVVIIWFVTLTKRDVILSEVL